MSKIQANGKKRRFYERMLMTDKDIEDHNKWINDTVRMYNPDLKDVSNEIGSGCYLSLATMRELVEDGDTVWICGRVKERSNNILNPESVFIEYVSPNLVSGTFLILQ
eukprot:UN34666